MKPLQLIDLMRLVATDPEPHKVLEKSYEWEHARRLEVGKWFLGTGAAALIAISTMFAKPEQPASLAVLILSVVSTLTIMIGLGAFWSARYIAARYTRIRAITAEFAEMKQFLQLLQTRGLL